MDKARAAAQEARLILNRFTEDDALALGQILVDLARKDHLGVVIDIRTPNRTLFHAALPGSAPINDNWARRKSNTVLATHKSSLLNHFENAESSSTLGKHGLDHADYSDHGGAVPIRVKGAGMVAVATVSGLPHLEDHGMVVMGIETLMARQ